MHDENHKSLCLATLEEASKGDASVVVPMSIAQMTAQGTLPKAMFVPVLINSVSVIACADDPLDAAMANRRMARASMAMSARKQRVDAMCSAKTANPVR